MDDDTPNTEHEDAAWSSIECVQQTETECGCRVILHVFIAMHSNNAKEYERKIQRLMDVENLPRQNRKWVVSLLNTRQNQNLQLPGWLTEIIQ